MKIAIIGATSGIGLELLQIALQAGYEVTILARTPGKINFKNNNLRIIQGDALDPIAIHEVVRGNDIICDCLGTTNVTKPVTLFSKSTEYIASALKPDQLLISVTGIGTGDSKNHGGFLYDRIFMPLVLRRMYADKDRQEQLIKRKVKKWIIVRPGFLNNGPLTGRYRAITDLQGVKGGKISRKDVADFILSQIVNPSYIEQTPLLIY